MPPRQLERWRITDLARMTRCHENAKRMGGAMELLRKENPLFPQEGSIVEMGKWP